MFLIFFITVWQYQAFIPWINIKQMLLLFQRGYNINYNIDEDGYITFASDRWRVKSLILIYVSTTNTNKHLAENSVIQCRIYTDIFSCINNIAVPSSVVKLGFELEGSDFAIKTLNFCVWSSLDYTSGKTRRRIIIKFETPTYFLFYEVV